MAFRDETEALRARIDVLERELEDAERRVSEAEDAKRELIVLRARIDDLERQLGKKKPKPRVPRFVPMIGVAAVVAAATVLFTVRGCDGPDADASPLRGMVELAEHPNPPPLIADTVGTHDANAIGEGCAGYLPDAPLVVLRVTEPTTVRLWTESNADLVMLVRSENGEVRCDDDSGLDYNPEISTQLGPGDHRVWVGTFSEDERVRFSLHVEGGIDLDDPGLDFEGAPQLITLHPEQNHWGRTLSGRTIGDIPGARARPGCAGHVPVQRHVALELDEPRQVRLVARAEVDLVLVLRRPDGSFLCDDDGAGDFDPQVTDLLQPGVHSIWVGTYQVNHASDFELTVEATEVGVSQHDSEPPRLGRWNLTDEPLLSFSAVAEPAAPLATTQPGCRDAWSNGGRDLELVLDEPRAVSLDLTGNGAARLLVEHPDGTQTCTSPAGLPPTHLEAGMHRVWVAVPPRTEPTAFTLVTHAHPE